MSVFAFLSALFLTACSNGTAEEQAAEAAKEYYSHLIEGRDEEYIAGLYGADTIRDEYRRELCDNARQYVEAVKKGRQGIVDIRTVRTVRDADKQSINVFLMLCFGDSINEQVVVPMKEYKGRWVIR